MGAWGGYKNGQIPLKAMTKIQGWYFEPSVAVRLNAAIAEAKRHKINITIQEGYRPLGVKADMFIKDEHKTSTKSSNQWFQYGRMQRGETPAAAYPGNSVHGWGQAADITPGRQNGLLVAIMKTHGFYFVIPSESWHIQG